MVMWWALKTPKNSNFFKYVFEALIVELWLVGIYFNIFPEIIYMQQKNLKKEMGENVGIFFPIFLTWKYFFEALIAEPWLVGIY